jgi:hypothetical protein
MPLIAGLALACGGEEPTPDETPRDAGVVLDAQILGPDQDSDEWIDDIDNCPAAHNPEQRDRDRDGVGDDCDTCPSTPNGGAGGTPGQGACEPQDEVEPNDLSTEAGAVNLAPIGGIREVRGVIEAPLGAQAIDRYQVMLPARTLLKVRVARSRPQSLLEPLVVISSPAYTSPRSAEGLFVAAREIYAASAGVYEVAVSDRRGVNGAPVGGAEWGYALALEVIAAEPEGVTAPFVDRIFALSPIGRVGLYQIDLAAADFTRIELESGYGDGATDTGLDPILVVERADGTVLENADLAPGYKNARVILDLDAPETVRIAVDYGVAWGADPSPEVRLTVDQPATDEELEPNDLPSLSSILVFPGETSGRIDAPIDAAAGPPDEDWFSFAGAAGQVIGISGLIRPASQVDPIFALVTVDPAGEVEETLYVGADSSGNAPYLEAVLPESRTYHLIVADERNLADPPYRGGPLFSYGLFSEVIGIQPDPIVLTSSATFSGVLDPGGRVGRHLVVASAPTLIHLSVLATGAPELEPYFRIYGPGAIGQLGQGDEALAFLAGPETYVVGVQNRAQGQGGPNFRYDVQLTYHPLPGSDESEPNDAENAADRLAPVRDVARGALSSSTDVDRYVLTVSGGGTLLAQVSGRQQVSIYGPGGALLSQGVSGVTQAIAAAGDYQVVIEGPAGPYVLSVLAR